MAIVLINEIPTEVGSGADEILKLREELAQQAAVIEQMREAYFQMRNAAAGYSNFCDDSASVRRCELDYEAAEQKYRSINLQPCPEVLNKVRADALVDYYDYCYSQGTLVSPSDYAQRIAKGEA